jgi:leader peptidase (prepilin peptidase)/N-methyltransferase
MVMTLTPLEWTFAVVFVFLGGACIGSFLNVCIYRWPAGMSTTHPKRSLCFSCEHSIIWYDNLPILSWFLLRGRCRYCGASFSIRYALIEMLTGLLFLHVFWVFGLTHATLLYMIWTAFQIVGSMIDLDHTIIPDRITLTGTVLFPVAVFILNQADATEGLVIPNWKDSLFGGVFAAAFIYLVRFLGTKAFGREAMGLGDVKLMAMNGALLGWWRSLLVIMGLGPVLALVTVLILRMLARLRIERHTEIPFGPYLALGSYIALFWGDEIVAWWLGFPPELVATFDRPWRWLGW